MFRFILLLVAIVLLLVGFFSAEHPELAIYGGILLLCIGSGGKSEIDTNLFNLNQTKWYMDWVDKKKK